MRLLSRHRPGLWRPRCAAALLPAAAAALPGSAGAAPQQEEYRVFAANDLGMHCMQQDNSEIHILPPYNTVHAQLIRRGDNPDVILDEAEFTIEYLIASNTRSADKTNFWTYAEPLFGVALAPDIGLTGNGLSGLMTYTGNGDRAATGIPITPIDDIGRENPYPLATIIARKEGREVARTQTVVPVSWEINCNLCHNEAGKTLGQQVLPLHDLKHGTALAGTEPVLCAACHADPALGLPGKPEISTFSSAMHGAHASRMAPASHLAVDCYACHPGVRTQCQRDIHITRGLDCYDCHGGMEAVASPSRTPWVDEPSCGSCHVRPGFEFEEPGKLFRQSRGHGDVTCLSCHGSPHAITPTTTEVDNLQAIVQQGHAGMISECLTCHTVQPTEPFFHSREK